jgi:hypothetical protein
MREKKKNRVIPEDRKRATKDYARKQLGWAIWFCQQDLSVLRPGALSDAGDDLRNFLAHEDESWSNMITAEGEPSDYMVKCRMLRVDVSRQEMIDSQMYLKELFRRFADDIKDIDLRPSMRTITLRDPKTGKTSEVETSSVTDVLHTSKHTAAAAISANLTSRTYTFAPLLGGDLRDDVFSKVGRFLVEGKVELGQIRSCPECEAIFLLDYRPHPDRIYHCSTKHARLAATRKYRIEHKEELAIKEAQRGRTRYEKAVRRKFKKAPIRKNKRRPVEK